MVFTVKNTFQRKKILIFCEFSRFFRGNNGHYNIKIHLEHVAKLFLHSALISNAVQIDGQVELGDTLLRKIKKKPLMHIIKQKIFFKLQEELNGLQAQVWR